MRFMTSSASLRSVLRAPLAVVLLTGASTLLLQGCKDEALEAHAQAQVTIRKVADEFSTVMAKHLAQESDASIKTLTSLQSQIDGVREVSNEQRAAAGVLSASIAQATAEVEYSQAIAVGRSLQHDRLYVAAVADAAATLRSISDSQKNVSLASDRTYLQEQKKIGETSLKAAQDSLKQLEGPLSQLKTRIEERKGEIAALQANVESLRRKAIEAGALPGFPFVEKAAEEKAKVRDARSSVSNDELELSRVEPEHTRANLAHDGAKSVVSAAGVAMDELENFASTLSSESALTSKTADEYRALVETRLGEVSKRRDDLKAIYASIEQHLTKAVSAASNANQARGPIAENGKSAKLSAQATLATVLADQAANASADIQLHTALASAGDVFGGNAKQQAAIDALTKERDELISRAKETLVDAIGQLGEPSDSDKTATKGLRTSLNAMLAHVEGKAAPAGPAAPTANGAAGNAAAPATNAYKSGPGFASTDEFEAFMGGASKDLQSSKKFAGALRSTTVTGRAMADGMAELVSSMDPIFQAAVEKWGDAAAAAVAAGNPLGGRAVAGAKSETKAEYTVAGAMGKEQKMVLVKDGNAWFVDIESMIPGGASAPPAAAEMLSSIFKGMAASMKKASADIADRIRSGAISSADQLQQELQKAMMSGLGGMMGGGGGMGPAGGAGGQRGGNADQ